MDQINTDGWGKHPEEEVEEYDTIEMVNGTPGCADCGALLCLQIRERAGRHDDVIPARAVSVAMLPEPVVDVDKIQCGGCGAVLFEREET